LCYRASYTIRHCTYPRSGGTGSGPALPSTQPFCVTPPPGSMEDLHVKEEREREHVKIDDGIWNLNRKLRQTRKCEDMSMMHSRQAPSRLLFLCVSGCSLPHGNRFIVDCGCHCCDTTEVGCDCETSSGGFRDGSMACEGGKSTCIHQAKEQYLGICIRIVYGVSYSSSCRIG
jgi:hypothetical protein